MLVGLGAEALELDRDRRGGTRDGPRQQRLGIRRLELRPEAEPAAQDDLSRNGRRPRTAVDLAQVEVVRMAFEAVVQRLLQRAQALHRRHDLVDGARMLARVRGVSAFAAGRQPCPDHPDAVDVHAQVGRLADQRPVSRVAGLEDGPHPVSAALFLDHRGEEDVSAQLGAGRLQGLNGDQVGGNAGLHVARAAAPHATLGGLSGPRIVCPAFLRLHRDDVHVAGQVERTTAARPAQSPCHAGASRIRQERKTGVGVGNRVVGIGLDPLDLEPEPEQPLLHDALRALFVAEQAAFPDEPCGQVVQVVDPLVDGSGERGEHARIIGRRLGALPPPESRSGAPRARPCVPW